MSRSLCVQCLFLLYLPLALCGPLSVQFRKHKAIYEGRGADAKGSSGPGEPLFLTPYIEKGEIDQGTVIVVAVSSPYLLVLVLNIDILYSLPECTWFFSVP